VSGFGSDFAYVFGGRHPAFALLAPSPQTARRPSPKEITHDAVEEQLVFPLWRRIPE
jgi:hypothetical protein